VITDDAFHLGVRSEQDSVGGDASRSMYRSLNFHDWRRWKREMRMDTSADPLNPGVEYGGLSRVRFWRRTGATDAADACASGRIRRTGRCRWCFRRSTSMCCTSGRRLCFERGRREFVASHQSGSHSVRTGSAGELDAATAADATKGKRRGVIYTIGPSYVRAGEIWAGTDDGLVQLTQDEGKHGAM